MTFDKIYSHLKKFKVGIAGAGGLGSNCAVALARTGIGHIIISDFDIISKSNLNRQYYFTDQLGMKKVDALKENIKRINSDIIIETHDIKLKPESILEIYKGCDIIVEAFDDAEMKEMLTDLVLSNWPDIPLIIGSGMAGWGKTELILERRLDGNLIVCGDEISEVSDKNPPLAPRVGIVSNMQANVVIDILMNRISE